MIDGMAECQNMRRLICGFAGHTHHIVVNVTAHVYSADPNSLCTFGKGKKMVKGHEQMSFKEKVQGCRTTHVTRLTLETADNICKLFGDRSLIQA